MLHLPEGKRENSAALANGSALWEMGKGWIEEHFQFFRFLRFN
jgi:hypothetical protein